MARVIFKDLPDTSTPLTAENLNSLDNSIVVTKSGENLNNYKTAGTYYFAHKLAPTNVPTGTNGWLVVMDSGENGSVKQVWYRHGTNNVNDYETYVRTYNASAEAWSYWIQLITNSNAQNWTPTLVDADVNYSLRTGLYVKRGNVVYFWFRLRGTINSVSGNAYAFINGLPHSVFGGDTAGNLFEHQNCTADNSVNLLLRITNNQLCLQSDGAGAGTGAARWAAGKGTFYLGGSGFYLTNE